MKKIAFLFTLLLSSFIGASQNYNNTDYLEDLSYLKKTLPQKHTDLFAKISRAAFERKVDSISGTAPFPNANVFVAKLFEIMVAIGDEHSRIEVDFTEQLPIQFMMFKEGMFVTALGTQNQISLPAKLIAINKQPIEQVLNKFKKVIQHDNPSYFTVGLMQYLNNPSILHGLSITSNSTSATYTVEGRNGKRENIELQAVPKFTLQNIARTKRSQALSLNRQNDHYWFTMDNQRKTIYFNYSKCAEQANLSFSKFNDSLFAEIDRVHPEKLVLDLRDNGGGNSAILSPFIARIKESYLNKKGKFLILIGELTFSSALMNAVDLKRNTAAILIGTPTSGNVNHYGEVRAFSLPNTKIGIAYSTRYWETWPGQKGPLMPDLSIAYSVEDFALGKDEALDAVYRIKE